MNYNFDNSIRLIYESIFNDENKDEIINTDSVLDDYIGDPKKEIMEGTILFYDTGWNRSLPNWCRVISLTKSRKSCIVEFLGYELVSGTYNGYGECMPKLDEPGTISKHKYRISKDNRYVKIGDHYAYIWNGKPGIYTSD